MVSSACRARMVPCDAMGCNNLPSTRSQDNQSAESVQRKLCSQGHVESDWRAMHIITECPVCHGQHRTHLHAAILRVRSWFREQITIALEKPKEAVRKSGKQWPTTKVAPHHHANGAVEAVKTAVDTTIDSPMQPKASKHQETAF